MAMPDNKEPAKEKKLQLQTKGPNEELPPSILSKTSSPPPTLNQLQGSHPLPQISPIPSQKQVPLVPKEGSRETVMAGGAYLKDSSVSSEFPNVEAPKEPHHQKTPSVHAHFYVEETMKNKTRSRSGSSTSQIDHIEPQSSLASNEASKSQESLKGSARSTPQPQSSSVITSGTGTGGNEQQANIDPRLPQDDGKIHVLLGVCGALSTGKIKLIINKLYEIYKPEKISIQLILTQSSENFVSQETINILENVKKIRVWRDIDEWKTWKNRNDPVLHIELRRWADILVISPLTANTLSKISLGICDNLLTNVIRAWNTAYPILLAPAMVSYSYNAITTKRQLRLISDEMPWIEILKPSEKVFGSYGDIGLGGMMDWNEIVNKIVMKLGGFPKDEEEEEEEENIRSDKLDEEKDEDEDEEDEDEDDDDEEEDEEEDDDNDDSLKS